MKGPFVKRKHKNLLLRCREFEEHHPIADCWWQLPGEGEIHK